MALSIQAFRNIAQVHDNTVIKTSQSRQEGLKGSGFWSRLVGAGEKNVDKNQATMRAFFASIKEEMGWDMEMVAKNILKDAFTTGKPLKGYMVKETLSLLGKERERVASYNQDVFARWRDTPLPGTGLMSFVEKHLPKGSQVSKADVAVMVNKARLMMESASQKNAPLAMEDLASLMHDRYAGALARCTPQNIAELSDLCAKGLPPLSSAQLTSLRPLILCSEVDVKTELPAAVKLMSGLREMLPAIGQAKNAAQLLDTLRELNSLRAKCFAGLGKDLHGIDIVTMAVQGALLLNGTSMQQAQALASEVICGQAGREVLGGLNLAQGNAKTEQEADILALRGTFTMLLNGFTDMGAASDTTTKGMDFMGTDVSPPVITKETLAYLHVTGLIHDEKFNNLERIGNFTSMRMFGNATPLDLTKVCTCAGNTIQQTEHFARDGMAILFAYLPKLEERQPNGQPFTPETVWQTVFGARPGPDVTPDNLAVKLAQEWASQLNTKLLQAGRQDSENIRYLYTVNAFHLKADPEKVVQAVLSQRPEDKVLTRNIYSSLPVTPAPDNVTDKEVEARITKLASDLHRKGAPPTSLTMGNGQPIVLDPNSIADPVQKENYVKSGTDNPVINAVRQQLDTLCGTNNAQKIQTLLLLSQFGAVPFRLFSPIIDRALFEHTPCAIQVEKLDNGTIHLQMETTPTVSGYGKICYEIAPSGQITMTDFDMAYNRPR